MTLKTEPENVHVALVYRVSVCDAPGNSVLDVGIVVVNRIRAAVLSNPLSVVR